MIKVEFEGTDGAGKTTGLKYFVERAKQIGLTVVETREVGNPNIPACAELREFILFKYKGLTGEAQELIFSAMRYENDKWYRNLLNSKNPPDLVVSDRGWYSHLAYTDHNVSPEFTKALYKGVVGPSTLLPEVMIYFSVNTQTALNRRIRRGGEMDAIEMKGIEYQERVRKSFAKYTNEFSLQTDKFFVDANEPIESVQEQLDEILTSIVAKYKKRA